MQLQQQRIGTRKGRNKGKYERHSNFEVLSRAEKQEDLNKGKENL